MEVNLAGLEIKNPTMLAAGILGVSGLTLKRVAEAGAGAVITKSIGPQPREGYPNPTIVETDCGLLNAVGLANPGVEEFMPEIPIAKKGGAPVIASIFGSSEQEFAYVASRMEQAGADALELNVSCPHAKISAIGQSADLTGAVVRAVKGAVGIPIFVKLTPNVADLVSISQAAERAGADGLTCINTVRAMTIDLDTHKPILGNKIGGLSGQAIKPIAVRCVYEVYEAVSTPVIGSGGVWNWRDAVEFFLAGASAVQVGTAVLHKDLSVFSQINRGISKYMHAKGCANLKDLIGLSHRA